MIYGLPKTVCVAGTEYSIRSDFREILDIMEILNDVKLPKQERLFLTLLFFYTDFDRIPPEHYEEAIRRCYWFINGGRSEDSAQGKRPRLMDWEQDFPYIISPVNRVIGHEIRADAYLHWWTFLAAYMEIGECTFAQIVHIREMRSKGKPLDKADKEWYRRNQRIVDLKEEITETEENILKLWGGE